MRRVCLLFACLVPLVLKASDAFNRRLLWASAASRGSAFSNNVRRVNPIISGQDGVPLSERDDSGGCDVTQTDPTVDQHKGGL